mgnify:FL=1|jgi:hypothetical protein
MAISNTFTTDRPVRRIHDDRLEVPDDPGQVFEELIAGDDRVCQECYRLLRHYERFPWGVGIKHSRILAFVDEVLPEGHRWDLLDREYFESVREPKRLERAYTEEGKESYCTGCGTMSPYRSPPPRSADRARDVAVQLSVTLHEFGIAHDWVHLAKRVQELKQRPEMAGNDFDCFSQATEEAIDRAGSK